MGRKPKYATQRTYQPYIDAIMEDLGLTGKVYLDFHFKKIVSRGGSANLFSSGYGVVNIANYGPKRWTIEALMHELRHIYQFYIGRLSESDVRREVSKRGKINYVGGRRWDGVWYKSQKLKKGSGTPEYYALPWEQDAREYEKELYRLFPGLNVQNKSARVLIGKVGNVTFYKVKG